MYKGILAEAGVECILELVILPLLLMHTPSVTVFASWSMRLRRNGPGRSLKMLATRADSVRD